MFADSTISIQHSREGVLIETECEGCSYTATTLIPWAEVHALKAGNLPPQFSPGPDGTVIMSIPCRVCRQAHAARGSANPDASSAIRVMLTRGDLAEMAPVGSQR